MHAAENFTMEEYLLTFHYHAIMVTDHVMESDSSPSLYIIACVYN